MTLPIRRPLAAAVVVLLAGCGGPDPEACEQSLRDSMLSGMAGASDEQIRELVDVDACEGLSEEQAREIAGKVMRDVFFPGLDPSGKGTP